MCIYTNQWIVCMYNLVHVFQAIPAWDHNNGDELSLTRQSLNPPQLPFWFKATFFPPTELSVITYLPGTLAVMGPVLWSSLGSAILTEEDFDDTQVREGLHPNLRYQNPEKHPPVLWVRVSGWPRTPDHGCSGWNPLRLTGSSCFRALFPRA